MHTYHVLYAEICHKKHVYSMFEIFYIIFKGGPTAPKSERLVTSLSPILLVELFDEDLFSLIKSLKLH